MEVRALVGLGERELPRSGSNRYEVGFCAGRNGHVGKKKVETGGAMGMGLRASGEHNTSVI